MTKNTIAVLPFVNIGSNPENEYFSDGITEEIINALAGIEQLKVISRTSSFFFKDKKFSLKEIAKQLDVAMILEGSVRMAHGIVRITTQLIQAKDDFHFWSESWDRKLENIFEIQDDISVLIAEKIREQFGHFEISDHLVQPQTTNVDAYAISLKARYHFNKWNPEDVRMAIDLYEKAVGLDSNHTESYVGLADAYGFMATTQFMPLEEAWSKAAAYTHLAYKLNPKNAGVHYQLANLAFFSDCNFAEAAQHTFKSLELKPNYPEAQQFMAFLYLLSGKIEKAHNHLLVALAIDPLNQETLFYKGYYLYRTRQYDKALEQFNDCITHNPKNLPALIVRSYCLLMLGKYDLVLNLVDEMPPDIAIPDEQLGLKCLAYILKKDSLEAQRHLDQLMINAEVPTAFQAHTYLFLALANMGKNDQAFAWLEEALKLKSSILLLGFSDPLVNPLTEDHRYALFHQRIYPHIGRSELTPKKKSPLLDAKSAEKFAQKLLDFVWNEKPYLNPNLTLKLLAELVEIHPNQVSWLINKTIEKNFNEFINHYRVEHFKVLAMDSANQHISLIGLAYESGFNSKTVFNTFFKKEVGLTPSQFLKKNRPDH